MKQERDEQLWQLAKARADFKTHLATYLIINFLLWMIWLITGGIQAYPWPIWPTVGWGIGVIFNYLAVYQFKDTTEKEYQKLKEQHEHSPASANNT